MQEIITAQMFDFGPLHDRRFEITNALKPILQTGDILYRASDARGPLNLPFSRLVARLTKSPYSHAAMSYVDRGEIYILEVNDQGTLKLRLIDWLDTCFTDEFSVYRLKNRDPQVLADLKRSIEELWRLDPDYDFTFVDPNKFYCTESVAWCCEQAGERLCEPMSAKEVVKPWVYWLIKAGNFVFQQFGTSFPVDEPMYFVGNEQQGMMSSDKTELVLHFTAENQMILNQPNRH